MNLGVYAKSVIRGCLRLCACRLVCDALSPVAAAWREHGTAFPLRLHVDQRLSLKRIALISGTV